MKPFTSITGMHKVGELANLHISTSMDGEHLYLDQFIYGMCTNHRNRTVLNRSAAKWLRKQLKKTLKTPEGCVS